MKVEEAPFFDGLQDPKLSFEALDPTEQEMVSDMMQTDGWSVLVTKLFPRQQLRLAIQCTKLNEHIEYWQGFYAGFKKCIESVRKAGEAEKSRLPRTG